MPRCKPTMLRTADPTNGSINLLTLLNDSTNVLIERPRLHKPPLQLPKQIYVYMDIQLVVVVFLVSGDLIGSRSMNCLTRTRSNLDLLMTTNFFLMMVKPLENFKN